MSSFRYRYRLAMPYILASYVLAIAVGLLYFNLRLQLEDVAVMLFLAAFLCGQGGLFVRDWGVFIAVLLAWQVASYAATTFNFPWHLTEPIAADRILFHGAVPAVWLQAHLYHPGILEPWDVMAVTMYMLHFLVPLLAGFALWLVNRELFHKYALAFVLAAIAGFVTYVVYPAVPPWMASSPLIHFHGQYLPPGVVASLLGHDRVGSGHALRGEIYLPGVKNLFNVDMNHWYNPYNGSLRIAVLHMSYDRVAAIPSEHAMYPTLFILFLRRQFGKRAYLGLIYLAGLLFSIVYLGQHYVVDAILGIAYAGFAYYAVMHAMPSLLARWPMLLRPRRVGFPTLADKLVPPGGSLEDV